MMKYLSTLLCLVCLSLLQACKFPLAIEGEGDIIERLQGERGCTLEEFQAASSRCTANEVTAEEYVVSYEAVPRDGWEFVGWEGLACDKASEGAYCDYNISQTLVEFGEATWPGIPAPATKAVFKRAETLLVKDFPIAANWTARKTLLFPYYGTGSGESVTVILKNNRAADPGPTGWELAWSEEFNEAAGTVPNPENWTHEIGDGTNNGIPGWGNQELQYYTDDPANAATDGEGNMVITVRESDGSLSCYYGACDYTSARLITLGKAEFAYGRIEARIKVPAGRGLWPAFWSLGSDIATVSWPSVGEIDFMEFVGKAPNEVYGTIHGPGYSGGMSYGDRYIFSEPVYNDYHVFAVEWEPDVIRWYVDGMLYHTATPDDVSPDEWVFNDDFFLVLNVAVGGSFGGPVSDSVEFPVSMAVDYLRIYQAPDTAERFETSFIDAVAGWQDIKVPFAGFTRSDEQPAGAPNDGLNQSEVWGVGFVLPPGASIPLDEVEASFFD